MQNTKRGAGVMCVLFPPYLLEKNLCLREVYISETEFLPSLRLELQECHVPRTTAIVIPHSSSGYITLLERLQLHMPQALKIREAYCHFCSFISDLPKPQMVILK